MIVVKVGGSLFDHPGLGPGLARWMAGREGPFLLVPGGGTAADAVREWDGIHGIGDAGSHWLAVRAMSLTAAFLAQLLTGPAVVRHPREASPANVRVLDPFDFCRQDEALPQSWDVTSDSIAARAAVDANAGRLVLLKSVDVPPGVDWTTAAAEGYVDAFFPRAVSGASFPVEVVNFRGWLDGSP